MKIFCVSTGRCGTMFTSEMFRSYTTFPSFHEPKPFCIGSLVDDVNNREEHEYSHTTKRILREKMAQINNDSDPDGNYFESSQMFIKSYVGEVFKTFGKISAIYIERNPIDVLLSYHLKCPWQESSWFMESHWEKVLLKTEKKQSFLENILWEWYEIRERWNSLKHLFDKTYELDFANLNNIPEWEKIFAHFEIDHRVLDNIPNLKKNAIQRDDSEVLKDIIEKWKIMGKRSPQATGYELLSRSVDIGKRAISDNSRRLSKCMM